MFKMGKVKALVQLLPIIVEVGIVMMSSPTEAFPIDRLIAEERMITPPRFPYDPPYGYHTSGILCWFADVPYFGGWAGRSCQGPIAPFHMPTPPSTTAATVTTTTVQTSTASPLPYYYHPMAAAGSLRYNSYLPHPYPLMSQYHTEEHNPDNYADYGDPVEGNPWEPDDDDVFIESYGVRAGRSGFKLGDPHRNHRHHK